MQGNSSFIVFDCFGVLYLDAFKQFLEEYSNKLPQQRQYYYELIKQNEYGYLSDDDFYNELSTDSGVAVSDLKTKFNNIDCLNTNLATLIGELKATGRYKIGLLSNVERGFLQKFLDNHNIAKLFDHVLASSEVYHSKPEREIFEELARRADMPFETWYFIDDSETNVAAAQSYGIASHLFEDTHALRIALQKAGIL
jgi:HAD superfamily hydrolase (TIGR01509 family)